MKKMDISYKITEKLISILYLKEWFSNSIDPHQ